MLHQVAITFSKTCMMDAHSEFQSGLQGLIYRLRQRCPHLCVPHVEEPLGVFVCRTQSDQVEGSQTSLPATAHEDDHRTIRGVLLDGCVCGFVHRRHPGTVVLLGESGDVGCQGHGSHRWLEVVQPHHADAEPVPDVVCVCESSGQADEPDWPVCVGRDVTHTRHDDFQNGSSVLPQQMDLIDDHQRHATHVRSVLPVSRDAVPFFRSRDHHVCSV
mmetsp:Transcript_12038/g.23202  ORF Transcript_12038/g.23202 Transcript_12038/m.23202 type:complete len:216 (-) Transcript_12038:136-783(-)